MSVSKLSLVLTLLLALAVVSAFPAKARTIDERYAIDLYVQAIYHYADPEVNYLWELDSLSRAELEELLPLLEDVGDQIASRRSWDYEGPILEDVPYFMYYPNAMDMRFIERVIAEVRDRLDALIYDIIIEGRVSRGDDVTTALWMYLEDDSGREYYAYEAFWTIGRLPYGEYYDSSDRMLFWLKVIPGYQQETWGIIKQEMLEPGYYQDVEPLNWSTD